MSKMSGWTGFSEEELRKIQQNDSAAPAAAGRVRKAVLANRSRHQLQREKGLLRSAAQRSSGAGSPSLPLDQQLTKPPLKEEAPPPPAVPTPNEEMKATGDHRQPPEEQETPAVIELEKEEVELREKTRLEFLQQEQKIMEEKNKRKKALLAKTIAEKSKQTHAEAVKLRRIQKELQALDDSMSNGIGILRSRIEQASMEYSAARKRYERAEVEFVTSKLDLHKKAEVKEQLTEHLCTIIQQNELRKARKLEELMQQLQLHATEEEQLEEEEQDKNRSGENQDGAVQSTQDSKEEVEEAEAGAQSKAEEDLQTIETLVQREVLAS